jgi:hypothetical protein
LNFSRQPKRIQHNVTLPDPCFQQLHQYIGFVLYLLVQIALISKLWASLTDIAGKQENHQGTTLIVIKIILKIVKQKWSPEPTIKNGA